jgi:hypothetical protein
MLREIWHAHFDAACGRRLPVVSFETGFTAIVLSAADLRKGERPFAEHLGHGGRAGRAGQLSLRLTRVK